MALVSAFAKPFSSSSLNVPNTGSPSKRKRAEDYDGLEDIVDDEAPPFAESDDEDDYAAPRKPKNTGKGKTKTRTPAGPKKPRAPKANGDTSKTRTRKGRKAGASKVTTLKASEETKLSEDNALFSRFFA